MAKYEVQIVGVLPDCLLIEAESEDDAKDKAADEVLDILDFEAAPAGPAKPKCRKGRNAGNNKTN